MAENIQDKIKGYRTAPFDARFPNTNQTRNCFQNYLGEDAYLAIITLDVLIIRVPQTKKSGFGTVCYWGSSSFKYCLFLILKC